MVDFQAVLAEIYGLEKIGGRPYNARTRKKRCSIVVRHLQPSPATKDYRPVPILRRPEPKRGDSIPEQRIAVMVGLILRRAQVRRCPDAYLAQARRLLLLEPEFQLSKREGIRLLVSPGYFSLLPDRPRWMQVPSEPIWPKK
jgi:hypothetical protein